MQSEKIINKTNSKTPRALDKVCGKLISLKLVMRDATQLQARLQSQLKSISPGISSTSKNSRKGN